MYDTNYLKTSLKPKKEKEIVLKESNSKLPTNVKVLQKEIEKLQLIITGKEQDLMEFRSKKKN